MDEKTVGNKQNNDSDKKRNIPLHKTFIWGIVFCISILMALVLYQLLISGDARQEQTGDFLKIFRDNHSQAIKGQGLKTDRERRISKYEEMMLTSIGVNISFPKWFTDVPNIEIIGAKGYEIDGSRIVFLVFSKEDDSSSRFNFVTIYDERDEIEQFNTIVMGEEEHLFHVSTWNGRSENTAYFWSINDDNQIVTYALISDVDLEELQIYTLEIMRSLKMLHSR